MRGQLIPDDEQENVGMYFEILDLVPIEQAQLRNAPELYRVILYNPCDPEDGMEVEWHEGMEIHEQADFTNLTEVLAWLSDKENE